MGRPATGRHARVMITIPDRHADGKIAESWAIWDTLGMLQQLGLVSSSSGAQQPA
ncbi:ester cyclase [Mycolicibacterium smegmatis]|uniref:ester cyclase n=1 Tax=Mycolicibacterium smegmatis TaxID=1772 RepID=UPI0020A242BD|nr:ester cyclase [Mycolicibacterium smegmatis]MCP2624681.1 ester cyclase [Mycolicibacterium smegmatis]